MGRLTGCGVFAVSVGGFLVGASIAFALAGRYAAGCWMLFCGSILMLTGSRWRQA